MLHLYTHANNAPALGIQPGRTCRVGASIVPGACHVGARGLGMLGSEIKAATATGEHGAGLLMNDGVDDNREYRLVITASTFAAGSLQVFEDGSIDFTGSGTATQTLYESGVSVGSAGLDSGFDPPTVGVLGAMQAARSMPAFAGSYAPPGALGVLPAMQAPRSMPAIAGTYSVPAYSGALGSMQAARGMPAIAGSYQAPIYTGAVPDMQRASSMPAIAGLYSSAAWTGVLPAMQLARAMPAIAGAYVGPGYQGVLLPMLRTVEMAAFVGVYTAPSELPQATPGYATQEDMRVRFGQTELVQLTDRAPTADQVDTDVMGRALLDADAEINMRLHSRYALPLENVPRVLVNIACDIARWRLMEDRATDQVTRRYEEALKLLDRIAQGKLSLGLEAGESRLKATGGPAVTGGARVFSRKRLADYAGDN